MPLQCHYAAAIHDWLGMFGQCSLTRVWLMTPHTSSVCALNRYTRTEPVNQTETGTMDVTWMSLSTAPHACKPTTET